MCFNRGMKKGNVVYKAYTMDLPKLLPRDLGELILEDHQVRVVNRVLIAEGWTDDEILQSYVIVRWQPFMQRIQNFISMKIANGIFRQIEPDMGARMIVGSFIAAILPVLRGVEPPPSPEQRRNLAVMIVESISNGLNKQKG